MAAGKKSFILYCDLINTVKKLPDEKAGELFKLILSYVNDENPVVDDFILDLVFEPIKLQLKRDLEGYRKKLEQKGWSGILGNMKRWHIDLYNQVVNEEITIEEAYVIYQSRKPSQSIAPRQNESQTIAKIADTDNVTVTVNDTVNVNESDIKTPAQVLNLETEDDRDLPEPSNSSTNKPTSKKQLLDHVKVKGQNVAITEAMAKAISLEIWTHYGDEDGVWRKMNKEVVLDWRKQVNSQWLTDAKILEFKNRYLKLHPQQQVASLPKSRNN